jgi:hypothetical protein
MGSASSLPNEVPGAPTASRRNCTRRRTRNGLRNHVHKSLLIMSVINPACASGFVELSVRALHRREKQISGRMA